MHTIAEGRTFLKSDLWEQWAQLETDQKKKLPPLPIQKPVPENAVLVELVNPLDFTVGQMPVIEAMARRRSQRAYTGEGLSLEELSFLLWATQGVSKILTDRNASLRTVPSAGARHPLETYLWVNGIERLEVGLYRYLPVSHQLCRLSDDTDLVEDLHHASNEQYVLESAVVFVWTAIPYRTEWRYSLLSHKMIAMDVGHVCQNLYLACEAIGAGTCAIGAYNQALMDNFLEIDGYDEFTIYMATVGRPT